MLMEISHTEIAPATAVVTLTGKLMMGPESAQIVNLVDDLMQRGKRIIVFDMGGVTAIDSTGIGRFIYTYNKLAGAGGDMRMAGATGHVFQTFKVSLLDKVFRFFPSVEDAVSAA
ncbi:MAG TPA: STAS domain-containing protein [Terracidiphilus sp.]|nr:putative Anti-sigma factor antagonist [Candidatus Sulfopaludibacter sp. SbA4]HXR38447.1 STAS domain-containing protein [Terracidiphilus sp.]